MFCDDDDIYMPTALAAAREGITKYPDNPLIFRMQYGTGKVLWHLPRLELCNVGTPMFVVPNWVDQMPSWSQFDEWKNVHDFMWIKAFIAVTGAQPIFLDRILSIIRPRKDQLPKGA
jgi:hypothetical protein